MKKIPGDYQYKALHRGNPIQRRWHKAKIDLLSRVAPPMAGARVLDAACGSGVISEYLNSRGAEVMAVDTNKDCITFAQRQFQKKGLTFLCKSIFDINGHLFDTIYCLEAIEHFPQNELLPLLNHFKGILKPGGRLFLTTPNYASPWPIIEWCLDTFGLVPKLKGDQHVSRLTPNGLGSLLTRGGWHILEMGTFNGLAPFCAIVSHRLSDWLFRRELKHRTRLCRNLIYVLAEPLKE